jgi:hypothetical protein
MRRIYSLGALLGMILFPLSGEVLAQASKNGEPAMEAKVLVGYQGWFRCPGDGSPRKAWSHWSRGNPSPDTISVELYPDTSELDGKSLCPLPDMTVGGVQANLFSSFPKETIEKHFEWMRTYQIDGALIQRFINSIPQQREEGDAVLKNVRTTPHTSGRVFAVEYDLSGAHADTVFQQLQDDWRYLTDNLHIISSPAYLKRNGKPVVSIWGLGFSDKDHIKDPPSPRAQDHSLVPNRGTCHCHGRSPRQLGDVEQR